MTRIQLDFGFFQVDWDGNDYFYACIGWCWAWFFNPLNNNLITDINIIELVKVKKDKTVLKIKIFI